MTNKTRQNKQWLVNTQGTFFLFKTKKNQKLLTFVIKHDIVCISNTDNKQNKRRTDNEKN